MEALQKLKEMSCMVDGQESSIDDRKPAAKVNTSKLKRRSRTISEKSQENDELTETMITESSTGEESEDKTTEKPAKCPILPPCRVCGDQATGLHYGATTCEACKGFFRRCLVRKKEFTCITGRNDCDVMAPKKAPCPGCRRKRCLAAGMSKKSIKRGRYSLVRKTHHIMEVKGLQATDLSPAPSAMASESGSSSVTQTSTNYDATKQSTVLPSPDISKNIHDMTKATAFEEFRKLKSLTDALCQSYEKYCRFPDEILDNRHKMQQEYAKQKHEQTEFFGPWDLVDSKTFLELYKSTGIDVDFRIAYFKHRLANIEQSICNLVAFAKSIPGFRTIDLADQMTLVKSVQFHWWFLCSYPGICTETRIYTSPIGDSLYHYEMQRFTSQAYADMVFNMGELFQRLELDDTERALVIALCVFSSDYAVDDLKDFATIGALHQQIGEALYFYTKSHDECCRFGHIISALTSLRSAEGTHIEGRNKAWKIFEETQFVVDVPPLIMELWAGMVPAVDPERVMQAMAKGQVKGQVKGQDCDGKEGETEGGKDGQSETQAEGGDEGENKNGQSDPSNKVMDLRNLSRIMSDQSHQNQSHDLTTTKSRSHGESHLSPNPLVNNSQTNTLSESFHNSQGQIYHNPAENNQDSHNENHQSHPSGSSQISHNQDPETQTDRQNDFIDPGYQYQSHQERYDGHQDHQSPSYKDTRQFDYQHQNYYGHGNPYDGYNSNQSYRYHHHQGQNYQDTNYQAHNHQGEDDGPHDLRQQGQWSQSYERQYEGDQRYDELIRQGRTYTSYLLQKHLGQSSNQNQSGFLRQQIQGHTYENQDGNDQGSNSVRSYSQGPHSLGQVEQGPHLYAMLGNQQY